MKESNRKWHHDVLSTHNAIMFDTLVHQFNIQTETVKSFTFEDEYGMEIEPLRGYLAVKETDGKKSKYFIEEQFYDYLPIRVNNVDELYLAESSTRKSIVLRPTDPTPFRINPDQTFENVHYFINELAPFEHTNPDGWTILKIIAVMGYVGKTFIGISSQPEFGKSSIFEILHAITQKSPVFQPRSIPGVLIQINGDGNIVFDEVHKSDTPTKTCMENFTLQVAGNKPIYINGAMRTTHTKAKYDVTHQSITYLYNTYQNYKDPDNEFFDYLFSNNDAINSRLLKLKFDGILTEKFNKDFNIVQEAEDNKLYYMKIAKYMLWLKNLKITNGYTRRYFKDSELKLKGRRKLIYDEITWMIDMYSNDVQEYNRLVDVLDKAVIDYWLMVGKTNQIPKNMSEHQTVIEEEFVEDGA